MTKETRIALLTAAGPMILAFAAYVNAHANRVTAEAKMHEAQAEALRAKQATKSSQEQLERAFEDFEDYVEYKMRERGCEPE